jgi:hypothetical protein
MTWVDSLDFDLAFRRVQNDKRDDPYPVLLNYKDFRFIRDEFLQELKESIENSTYITEALREIPIPKSNFTMRPTGALNIYDRVIYQALIDFLSQHFEPEPCVFSYRLRSTTSNNMFVNGVDQWKSFQNEIEGFCQKFPFMLETDLAAYFEHIDLHRLGRVIADICKDCPNEVLTPMRTLLHQLLFGLNGNTRHSGIPQVCDPSSFLGNMYLDEFDKWVQREGLVYIRYVDDMRFFCKSKIEARKTLAKINMQLRLMGLFLSSAKTEIKPSEVVLEELDLHRSTMTEIDEAFRTKRNSQINDILPKLWELFDGIVKNDGGGKFRDRHFRFCIYRFRKLKAANMGEDFHPAVVNSVLERLKDMPHATDVFALYLSQFNQVDEIPEKIIRFLNSDANIYPWQEMHLLDVLIRLLNPIGNIQLNEQALLFARGVCANQNAHPACRSRSIILIGKLGDYQDRRRLRDSYDNEHDFEIKKAILIALQEMNNAERNHFYQSASEQSGASKVCVNFLLSLTEPIYHQFNPPVFEGIVDDLLVFADDDIDDIWY